MWPPLFLPVVKRLAVCEELDSSSCGTLLFYAQLNPPGEAKGHYSPLSFILLAFFFCFFYKVFDELSLETQQVQTHTSVKPG